jgi:hypothetical protein
MLLCGTIHLLAYVGIDVIMFIVVVDFSHSIAIYSHWWCSTSCLLVNVEI